MEIRLPTLFHPLKRKALPNSSPSVEAPEPNRLEPSHRTQLDTRQLVGSFELVNGKNPLSQLTGYDSAWNQRKALAGLLWKLSVQGSLAEVGNAGRNFSEKAARDVHIRTYLSLSGQCERLVFPSGSVVSNYSGDFLEIERVPKPTSLHCLLFWGSWETRGLSEYNCSLYSFSKLRSTSAIDDRALVCSKTVLDEGGCIILASSRFAKTPVRYGPSLLCTRI